MKALAEKCLGIVRETKTDIRRGLIISLSLILCLLGLIYADIKLSFIHPSTQAKVIRVIDGDTIVVDIEEQEYVVRYIGIDAPEKDDPRTDIKLHGLIASGANMSLVCDRMVTMQKDISETDKYGRLLRYVWINGSFINGVWVDHIFVNDYLVRNGYAWATPYPPDIMLLGQLKQAQKEAQQNNLGLWEVKTLPEPTSNPTQSAPEPPFWGYPGQGVYVKIKELWYLVASANHSSMRDETPVGILFITEVKDATVDKAFGAAMVMAGAAQERLLSKKQVTLADGTSATEARFTLKSDSNQTWQAQGMPPDAIAVGVENGGSWIIAVLFRNEGLDEAKVEETLYTLRVKRR